MLKLPHFFTARNDRKQMRGQHTGTVFYCTQYMYCVPSSVLVHVVLCKCVNAILPTSPTYLSIMLKLTHTRDKKIWSCKKSDIPIHFFLAMEAHQVSTDSERLVPKTQLRAVKAKMNVLSLLTALAKED